MADYYDLTGFTGEDVQNALEWVMQNKDNVATKAYADNYDLGTLSVSSGQNNVGIELENEGGTTLNATIPAATNSQAGVMSAADKNLLGSVVASIEGVSVTKSGTAVSIDFEANQEGLQGSATIGAATSSHAGVMSASDKAKLDAANGALATQTYANTAATNATNDSLTKSGFTLVHDLAGNYYNKNITATETSAAFELKTGNDTTAKMTIPAATNTSAGLMSAADKTKLEDTYLSSGKPAIINGVINGQGQWIASGQGFSDCLVVPIIAGETIVVTYSEDVSLIDRSFFKSFDAKTKEIVFAEGYSGNVANNGTYRVVTRVAPDDASFFYTAYNRTKIISITVGGVEVYASTPASRLLQEELHVADLSRQALRTSDLTLSVGSNLADKEKITTGYVSTGGGLANSDDWKRIAVDVSNIAAGTKLTFGGFYLGRTGYWAFYRDGTASTDKISNGSYADPQGSSRPVTVEVPEGAVTLYITIFKEGSSTTPEGWTTPYDELTCSRGTTLQPFVPYVKVVTAIKGYALAGTSQGSGGSGGGGDIVADLPLAPDGAGIETGYAYIDSITGTVKVKLSQTEQL